MHYFCHLFDALLSGIFIYYVSYSIDSEYIQNPNFDTFPPGYFNVAELNHVLNPQYSTFSKYHTLRDSDSQRLLSQSKRKSYSQQLREIN